MHPPYDLLPDCLELCPKALGDCFAPDGISVRLGGNRAYVRESQEVERFRLPLPTFLPVRYYEPSKLDEAGFLRVHLQSEFVQPLLQLLQKQMRFISILEPHDPVSSPGESHPQALSEPDVNLSAHPAPIIQPQA